MPIQSILNYFVLNITSKSEVSIEFTYSFVDRNYYCWTIQIIDASGGNLLKQNINCPDVKTNTDKEAFEAGTYYVRVSALSGYHQTNGYTVIVH
jgi:hypothetical protein